MSGGLVLQYAIRYTQVPGSIRGLGSNTKDDVIYKRSAGYDINIRQLFSLASRLSRIFLSGLELS